MTARARGLMGYFVWWESCLVLNRWVLQLSSGLGFTWSWSGFAWLMKNWKSRILDRSGWARFFAQVKHTRNKLMVGLVSIKLWIVFCVAYLFVGIGNELDMSLFESRSFAVQFLISKSAITYICIKVNSTTLDSDIFGDWL